MWNKIIRNLLLIFLALCSTWESWSSSCGWEAGFFTLITKSVISLLHTCACKSTEPLEHCLPCAPLFSCFFCIIPSFTRRFSREALGKTWRESLTPSHSPVLLAAGMAPLHLPAGYNHGCVFLQTPGSERGCSLPFTLLSVAFPVSVYERLLHITQMQNSLVLSWALPYDREHVRVNMYLKDTEILDV